MRASQTLGTMGVSGASAVWSTARSTSAGEGPKGPAFDS